MAGKRAESFAEWLKRNIAFKLQAQTGRKLPGELENIPAKLSSLGNPLKKRNAGGPMKESSIGTCFPGSWTCKSEYYSESELVVVK